MKTASDVGQAFFLPLEDGERFCLYHAPSGPPLGAFVHVQALGDEMNLTRRMSALLSRRLAAAGVAVLQIDLYGCGDSAGEFADARWPRWVADICAARRWLHERTGQAPGLWGVRAGALLAAAAAAVFASPPPRFLFWQPLLSGEAYWRQWLRTQRASEWLAVQRDAPAQSRQGNDGLPVEVAGYTWSPALIAALQSARLELPGGTGAVTCLDVGSGDGNLPPTLTAACADWQRAGWQVHAERVVGEAFWQLPEAADGTRLLERTLALLGHGDAQAE